MNQYSTALALGGYSTGERGGLTQALLFPWFSRSLPCDKSVEYPRFVLFRKRLGIGDFWGVFEGLVRTRSLELPGIGRLRFGGDLGEPTLHAGAAYPFYSQWPFTLATLSAVNDGRVVHRKLSVRSADLYPGPQDALEEWTGISTGYGGYAPVVYCLFPDFRGRISSVDIRADHLLVKAKVGPAGVGPLSLKYYAKAAGKPAVHGDARVLRGGTKLKIGYQPERFIVDLYQPQGLEPLDWRDFDVRSGLPPSDVRFSSSAETLLSLIAGGESTFVEFKSQLPSEELAETVCAFANTKGGTIIVGVTNGGQIRGFSHPKYGVDHVDNVVSASVDPIPVVSTRSTSIRGHPLLVIQVQEGASKPYMLRQRGVYIRSNATDRVADRNETIELSRQK